MEALWRRANELFTTWKTSARLRVLFAASTFSAALSMSSTARPARVIFMHGLGDTPAGWADTLREAFRERLPHVTFELPEAPKARVTCNGGMVMTSWMDLHDIPIMPEAFDDEPSLSKSIELVHRVIDEAVESGVPPERIVLGGFSQGGAMAFISTLRYPKRLAGCAVLSGWAPFANKEPIAQSANAQTVSATPGPRLEAPASPPLPRARAGTPAPCRRAILVPLIGSPALRRLPCSAGIPDRARAERHGRLARVRAADRGGALPRRGEGADEALPGHGALELRQGDARPGAVP